MDVTVITFVGWVSRPNLGALTLSRAPGPTPRPCPLSDLSPPLPHHPTPTAHPSAPLQLAPPQALPCLSHPITLACCFPCLSLSLSLSNKGLTRTPLSPGRRPRPAHHRLHLDCLPTHRTTSLAASPDTVGRGHQRRHHRPPPGPAQPPQAHARPALDAATHLPWPLLHPTLSTSRPPTPPASLSHCPAHRPPNSGQRLWMSLARLPPLDATSRLGLPPLDAIGQPARALVRYSSPTAANECPSKV
jgi:hypothetical protein